MMFRSVKIAAVFLGVTVLIAGCAQKQVILEPEIPVFRYEQYVHNEGFRGKFASESHDVITVTPDRKKTDSTFKWTGAILGKITSEQHKIETVRLDKDLIWRIDMNKKRYLEFPIKKMAMQVGVVQSEPTAETVYVEDCVKCTVKSGIKRTGTKKIVNGYDAEQIILTWSSTCAGKEKGEPAGTTSFTLEVWLAPGVPTGAYLEAFNLAYAKKVGMDIQMLQVVGDQFLKTFPSLKDLALMMKDLKGYPVLSTLSVENDQYLKQAQEDRKRRAEQETKQSPTSPTDMVTGFFGKKMKEHQEAKEKEEDEKWGNVIWRVSWESRNFQKMQLTASAFNLEDDLKKVEQKEYMTGEQGQAVVEVKPARFVKTACLSNLTEAQLGAPIYPGAQAARSRPYDEGQHNTKWYYAGKDDYRVQYATADPMDKVVSFYEGKFKKKCQVADRKDGGLDYKEAVCTQPAGAGLVRTFRMTEQPIEISTDVTVGTMEASEQTRQKILGFELSTGKNK
ncbi:MAG: hypothetical protein HY283_08145 [Nitrospirae bacterium]|nr:hypothetical protein [Nitrospirota bacterium]